MIVQVRINVEPALQFNKAVLRQIPFATSVAIDRTIKDVQRAIQDHVGAAFTLRRPDFIKGTIKITQFSKKHAPTSTLSVDPNRNFLGKFEQGGSKIPSSGSHLAVPIEARKGKGVIVPPSLRPAGLGGTAFKITTKKGKQLLVQRIGKSAVTKRRKKGVKAFIDPHLKVMYYLAPSVPIQPSLHFLDIANVVSPRQWPIRVMEAMNLALTTAKREPRAVDSLPKGSMIIGGQTWTPSR